MMAAAFPEPIRCASCKRPIDSDGNVVILVTIARNPVKAGLPGRDFVGYDAALCNGDCLRVWASTVEE
jgi:hypothetical protein